MKKLIVLRGVIGMLYAIPDILHGAGILGWEAWAGEFEVFRRKVEELYVAEAKTQNMPPDVIASHIEHMQGKR